jgi:hypothetical protein
LIGLAISGASIALQALDQLLAAHHRSAGSGAGDSFSTGQSLPVGAAAKTLASASVTPAGQFAPATLGALAALQDIGQRR